MKKLILAIFIVTATATSYAQTAAAVLTVAQFIPTFQFGLKGGVNLTGLSTSGNLSSSNQAGYLFGAYAKVGKNIQFEPEIYITGKNVTLTSNTTGQSNTVKFTSIDVPLLLAKNWGFGPVNLHAVAGPVVSFVVDANQSLGQAYDHVIKFEYGHQAVDMTVGGGFDLQGFNVDLRYELGLNKLSKDDYPGTHTSLFNLTVGIRVY